RSPYTTLFRSRPSESERYHSLLVFLLAVMVIVSLQSKGYARVCIGVDSPAGSRGVGRRNGVLVGRACAGPEAGWRLRPACRAVSDYCLSVQGRGLGGDGNSRPHRVGDGRGPIDSAAGATAVADDFCRQNFGGFLPLHPDVTARSGGGTAGSQDSGNGGRGTECTGSDVGPVLGAGATPVAARGAAGLTPRRGAGPHLTGKRKKSASGVHEIRDTDDEQRDTSNDPARGLAAKAYRVVAAGTVDGRSVWSRRSACDWLLNASFITTPHNVNTTAFMMKNATANEPVVNAQD